MSAVPRQKSQNWCSWTARAETSPAGTATAAANVKTRRYPRRPIQRERANVVVAATIGMRLNGSVASAGVGARWWPTMPVSVRSTETPSV